VRASAGLAPESCKAFRAERSCLVVKMSQIGWGRDDMPCAAMTRMVVAALIMAGCTVGWFACGGTSGHEDLPASANAGATALSDDAAAVDADATLASEGGGGAQDSSVYTNTFDVVFTYVDQTLPEVQPQSPAQGDAGAEAGQGLPNCPPFIPISDEPDGQVVVAESQLTCDNEVPADWRSDGGETFAAEGGSCATYPWLGSVAVDSCVTSHDAPGETVLVPAQLPPCNWAFDSGVAAQGPGAGASKYDLCIALYECFMRTTCFINPGFVSNPLGCLCDAPVLGSNFDTDCLALSPPTGPCLNEELAAMELTGDIDTQLKSAFQSFTQSNSAVGSEGRNLNLLFDYLTQGCQATFCMTSDAGVCDQ
jgi:hypothetical protein